MTRILTSEQVEGLFAGAEARDRLRGALVAVHRGIAEGRVLQPAPHPLADPALDPADRPAVVPMLAHDLETGDFVVKVLADAPANRARGLPAQRSSVALFDGATGVCTALIDGRALTRIRTAAVTAAATDALARPDAGVLALAGAGPLAVEHARALLRVRRFEKVLVWSRSQERAREAAGQIRADAAQPVSPDVIVAETVEEAVRAADVVCTLTPAVQPYLRAEWLRPGALVNAVGSPPRPCFAELLPEVFSRCALTVVDVRTVALAESGNVRGALEAGAVEEKDLVELGEVRGGSAGAAGSAVELAGSADAGGDAARVEALSASDVRVFNSVGVGAQDLAAARLVLAAAEGAQVGSTAPIR
ncbi:ornithine cyclodeaminase family protein [Microbacterium sp. gxy059]|uniref:ornithine cyclodeaminase family protein n=1 Tax=Microbacterium sp. gxy059 TaxID=2957199 RepID=UPI003D96BF07